MATQDTTEDEVLEQVEGQVETEQSEDENANDEVLEQESEETEDENEEESEDEEGDKPKPDDEEESKFQKRFSQIQGDTPEDYAKNLEEAYRQSSTEGQRLALEAKQNKEFRDKLAAAVAADPELAKRLEAATGEKAPTPQVDPALAWAKEEMNKTFAKEYNEFTDVHPEMLSDDALRDEVLDELRLLADVYDAKGKTLGMAEGLKKAWASLGYAEKDNKDKVMTQAKNQAAAPKVQSKPKAKIEKPEFSEEQISFAKKMGLTPEQLAEFNK